jgi:hypothetical protein
VLKEADTLNANQFGYEDTYGGITSQFCDLESGEDGNWRTKDHMHQVETCIEIAIQRQKEHLSIEVSILVLEFTCLVKKKLIMILVTLNHLYCCAAQQN